MNGLAAFSEHCKRHWLAVVDETNRRWADFARDPSPHRRMAQDGTWVARNKLMVHWGILFKLTTWNGWERTL